MRIIATLENDIVTFGHVRNGHTVIVRGRVSDLDRMTYFLVRDIIDYPDHLRKMITAGWNTFVKSL